VKIRRSLTFLPVAVAALAGLTAVAAAEGSRVAPGPLAPPVLSAPAATAIAAVVPSPVPGHPRELKYDGLKFEIPKADSLRFKLKSGLTVYVAEDHSLPLVNVSLTLRAGGFLDPAGKTGLASMTGTMLRQGGTARLTAEEFDEKADFLAAEISTSAGDTQAGANLNCLSTVLAPSLDLFFEMLRAPRFQQSRLDVEKGNWLEDMKQRNDDAGSILSREYTWLIYGDQQVPGRYSTSKDADAIGRDDLVAFHKNFWRPEAGMILAVSGDVKTKDILAELDRRFEGWKTTGPVLPWPPPVPTWTPKPGLYHVEKDIPQGKVNIGHLASRWDRWDNPDNFTSIVMNDILGGGGFTSRIVKKVRSDEGLAYSAGSRYGIGTWWPGQFAMSYQSKNPTVALAAKLSIAELKRLQDEAVPADELTVAKNSFIDTFPRNFESPQKTAQLFATDDFMGRPHSYWDAYRERISKVTSADVQRVAKERLHPDRLVFLVVGKWSEIEPGDANGRASMKEFFGGKVMHLPLRDPLTLQPMK